MSDVNRAKILLLKMTYVHLLASASNIPFKGINIIKI